MKIIHIKLLLLQPCIITVRTTTLGPRTAIKYDSAGLCAANKTNRARSSLVPVYLICISIISEKRREKRERKNKKCVISTTPCEWMKGRSGEEGGGLVSRRRWRWPQPYRRQSFCQAEDGWVDGRIDGFTMTVIN